MLIKYNNDYFESKQLIFNADEILLDKKRRISKNDSIDIILSSEEFSITKLINLIKKIGYQENVYYFITEDYDNVHIEYEQSMIDGSFLQIEIYIGLNMLNFFSVSDLAVFISHEVGHLLDTKNELKYEKANKIYDMLFLLLSSVITIKKWNEITIFQIIIIFAFFGLISLFIKRYHSRKLEYNADIYAVKILGDYKSVINSYIKLSNYFPEEKENYVKEILSTHPSMQDRINYIKVKYWYLRLWDFLFSTK